MAKIHAAGATGGTLISWGWSRSAYVIPPEGLTNVVNIRLKEHHGLALLADDSVVAWGPAFINQSAVPPNLPKVVAIAAGDYHNLVLHKDGTVTQWPEFPGVPVPTGLTDVRAIDGAYGYSVAVRSNGTVVLWGEGYRWPSNAPPDLTNIVSVAAGFDFALALTPGGRVVGWTHGTNNLLPIPDEATDVVSISASGSSGVALRTDGSVIVLAGPDTVPTNFWGLSAVERAPTHWLGLKSDGTLVHAGDDANGAMIPPVGLSNVLAIGASTCQSAAIVRVDDEHPPSLSVLPIRESEGDMTRTLNLRVSLSVPSTKPITFQFSTIEGTARAGGDFLPTNGTVTIPVQAATGDFSLTILGDSLREAEESFAVRLFHPSNAVLVTTQVSITLINDDTMSLPLGFGATVFATNLPFPTSMAFAPDGRLFVCEQDGRIHVIRHGKRLSTPFLEIPVETYDHAEAGLLGLAFDPGFLTNQFVYVYYSARSSCIGICRTRGRISRFTAYGNTALTNSEVVIFDIGDGSAAAIHNGGGLHFGPDGTLFVGIGDNALPASSQTLTNLLGKILRINPDGSIPTNNPFYSITVGRNQAIWALGLRNPFSFAFHPTTGQMLINDVGDETWEEINQGQSGANYGWPQVEGSSLNTRYLSPVVAYGHGAGMSVGCAITGATFCDPALPNFPPEYSNDYFFADYCNGWIRRLKSDNQNLEFAQGAGSPIDLAFGPDGALYCLSRVAWIRGVIHRISWADAVRIESATRPVDGTFRLRASSRPGHTYVLEASTNAANWEPLVTNTTLIEWINVADPEAATLNRRFYRLRE